MSSLSNAHCSLLAVQHSLDSNVQALLSLVSARQDAFSLEQLLRIFLTYLPESLEPSEYVELLRWPALGAQPHENATDTSPVKDLSDSQARKRARKLHLLPLVHGSYPSDGPSDPLTQFLYHRAHRIDEETGLLALVPHLITPFLDHNEFLRTWFISTVLPLLRVGYEYYLQNSSTLSLESFEKVDRVEGVNVLMSRASGNKQVKSTETHEKRHVGRDLRGVVGPWMYGDNTRKRRKLNGEVRSPSNPTTERVRRLSLEIMPQTKHFDNGWEYAYKWIVDNADKDFELVTEAFEDWQGPTDVDLGGYDDGEIANDESEVKDLTQRYAQAAFASIYASQGDTSESIQGAHNMLNSIASLINLTPSVELDVDVDMLPDLPENALKLCGTPTSALQQDVLLQKDHALTSPSIDAFSLLQALIHSAYQLSSLESSKSIINVAKFRFYSTEEEQLGLLQRILHTASASSRKNEMQWGTIRSRILWLWSWKVDSRPEFGAGVFCKIRRETLEQETLKALLSSSQYELATRIYLSNEDVDGILTSKQIEAVIVVLALQIYDNASNGNRTRGGMKKASDMVATFGQYFPNSNAFKRVEYLLAATHAISFYSLTLQHGVPFQPVNIRVSKDPIGLIQKVLEQNSRSYTNLDDLISIGKNFVAAGLSGEHEKLDELDEEALNLSEQELARKQKEAEARVTGMAIEASLAEDDFETAYSYIVNRFQPGESSVSDQDTEQDDTSWSSAVAAGKYRSSSNSVSSSAILRRLDQRMDLLSRALLLAPPSALTEILNAWRKVEEELATQLARDDEVETAWDDSGDKRSALPGAYLDSRTIGIVQGQPTREMGRTNARTRGDEEAPMGLFDVARGAAAAFNRTAFRNQGAGGSVRGSLQAGKSPREAMKSPTWAGSDLGSPISATSGDDGRVRKRDMAYNAATGALASGLGWVLGATPAHLESGNED
ncbi:MAG: hypothetical protein M1820_006031 [Bogoriella megaspora]|nr:MAG: hypothetical protein M1820_006031 [Bogoriella megaspora]